MQYSAPHTIFRVVRGLKLTFGILTIAVAYAAFITPILLKLIQRSRDAQAAGGHAGNHDLDIIDVEVAQ